MNPDPSQNPSSRKESLSLRLLTLVTLRIPGLDDLEKQEIIRQLHIRPPGAVLWVGRFFDRLLIAFAIIELGFLILKLAQVLPVAHWSWANVLRPLWEFIPLTIIAGMCAISLIYDFVLD